MRIDKVDGEKGGSRFEYFTMTEEEGRRKDSDPLYWPDRRGDMNPSTAFACDLRYPKFPRNTHFVEGMRMCIPPGTVEEVKNYGPRFGRQFRDRCAMHACNNAAHAAGRSDLTLSVDEMISGAAELSRREDALGADGAENHRLLMGNWMADAIPLAARLKFGDHRCVVRLESIGQPTRYPSQRTLGYVMSGPGNTHFAALSPQDGGVGIPYSIRYRPIR